MPAKSEKQLKYIYYLRNKYGSADKAPNKHKWVFKKEWGVLNEVDYIENINSLLKKNKKDEWVGNIPAVKKFLKRNFSHLEQLPDIYGGIEKYINKGTIGVVFKIKGKDLALKIEVFRGVSKKHYDAFQKIETLQKKGGAKNFKKIYYSEVKTIYSSNYPKLDRSTDIMITIFELCKPLNWDRILEIFKEFAGDKIPSIYYFLDIITFAVDGYDKERKLFKKYYYDFLKKSENHNNIYAEYFRQLFDVAEQAKRLDIKLQDLHSGNIMLSLDDKLIKIVDF